MRLRAPEHIMQYLLFRHAKPERGGRSSREVWQWRVLVDCHRRRMLDRLMDRSSLLRCGPLLSPTWALVAPDLRDRRQKRESSQTQGIARPSDTAKAQQGQRSPCQHVRHGVSMLQPPPRFNIVTTLQQQDHPRQVPKKQETLLLRPQPRIVADDKSIRLDSAARRATFLASTTTSILPAEVPRDSQSVPLR